LQGNLLDGILSELLGKVSPTHLMQARFNVVALCVFPGVVPRLPRLLFRDTMTPEALESYIQRQLTFALSGIASIRSASKV